MTHYTANSYPASTKGMNQQTLLQTVQHCAATCQHMVTMLLQYPDIQNRTAQIQLLRDCASICVTTAEFIARNSVFSRHLAHLCARLCEACGTECSRHQDAASQHCAQVCLSCAQECRSFAQ
jgi:hypothetical protein